MIARILSFLLLIGLLLFAIWLYLVSPSAHEKLGDQAMQDQDYASASMYYSRAMNEGKTSFGKERVLFKLGNSFRIQGERERAFDFYFMLLRLNKDSAYKERIEEFLREQKGHLALENNQDKVEIDWSFLNQKSGPMTLEQQKQKRDQLYRMLIDRLSTSGATVMAYETLELYRAFQKSSQEFLELRLRESDTLPQKVVSRQTRNLVFVGFSEDWTSQWNSLSPVTAVEWKSLQEPTDLIEQAETLRPQGIFIYMEPSRRPSDLIQLPRLADLYENSKFFLVFVDSLMNESQSDLELDAMVEEMQHPKLRWFRCQDVSDCRGYMRDLVDLRSLWQSNG
jgi:tetratricopeptide (TPR) repeat protein